MIAAASNGVNVTDGLDGLATGASVMAFAAYLLIGVWQSNNSCERGPARSATRSATRATWRSSRQP
jgi:phospho-N-acetylmuramoyl-pentapeptide-transferase